MGLLDEIRAFYAKDGVAGLLGMTSVNKQMADNQAKQDAMRQAGAPMAEQWKVGLDNPMAFALGTGNIGKAGPQMLGKLPMDEASRMARANQMFPVDAYHGTNKDISAFENAKRGGVTRARSSQKAHWFSEDASQTASGYAKMAGDNEVQKLVEASQAAERSGNWDQAHKLMVKAEKLEQVGGNGENVMPVRLRGNLKEYDMDGIQYSPDDVNLSAMLDAAKKEGFDGAKFTNFSDEAGYGAYNPTTHYAVFDPKNIRSRFAAFDPSKKDSSDLLASIGLLGMIGGGAAMTEGE
tara:strand:+ start:13 stop:894 length:882 start_codon:yes stop_codon:yes gene_type:complete